MTATNLPRWFSRLHPPIDGIYRAWASAASKRLSNLLGSSLKIDIAQIDVMTIDATDSSSGYLQAQGGAMLDYKLDLADCSDPWILRIDSGCVYHSIDRLLGASAGESQTASQPVTSRLLSAIDSKVASYVLEELAYPCLDAWQIEASQTTPRAPLQGVEEFKRQNSISITFQVILSTSYTKKEPEKHWQGQWLIPETFIKRQFGRLVFGTDQPVTLHAILARSSIHSSDLEHLEVGDIISTEQLASQTADVECLVHSGNMEILFRGEPGVYKGAKALRLLG